MGYDKFLVAPYNSGLQRNIEPWLLPEDAFERLDNLYVFRGKIHKRFGTKLLGDNTATNPQLTSRLRIKVGTTNGSGNLSGTVPGAIFKVGQLFSIGSEIFTVSATGTPGTMLTTGNATTHTFDTSTGAFDIQGAAATTDVYWYPAEPVMGLPRNETGNINDEGIIAFDTQFSYQRVSNAWDRIPTTAPGAADIWTGSDSDFFWSTTGRGSSLDDTFIYVVNYVRADHIRYRDTGASSSTGWTDFQPITSGTDTLDSARVILFYKDRMIALNTLETVSSVSQTFVNRCRFSQNGNPVDASNGWLDDTAGRGGYVDAATKEAIVSAEFIKDRLIVFFERSTWELVYTGNEVLPFRWQQINTELGCESTFSRIPFDKAILSVGNVGVHACNGISVERIDGKIPDEVFRIHNGNSGPKRVYGIRDYYSELVYWTFPNAETNPTFPNRILVYNYQNETWAFFRDTFTCFGYFQQVNDVTWATLPYATWADWTEPWNSGAQQSEFLEIIVGNQQGFTMLIDRDKSTNTESYQITNISSISNPTADTTQVVMTVVDNNFDTGEFYKIKNANGVSQLSDQIFILKSTGTDQVTLETNSALSTAGTYTGGGTLIRVSNVELLTKRYNPYIQEGINFFLGHVDFFVERTATGQVLVDYFPNDSFYSMVENSAAAPDGSSTALMGTNVLETSPYTLEPFESVQDKLWHRIYFGSGQFNLQLKIYMTDEQMFDDDISSQDFRLHGMLLYTQRDGRLQ